jgi:hypothetical protein
MKQKYFTVNASVVNIYSDPGCRSAVVCRGLLGDSDVIMDSKGDWFNVTQCDCYSGWIHKHQGILTDKTYDANLTVFEMDGVVTKESGKTVIRDLTFGNNLNGKPMSGGFSVTLPDGEKGWTSTLLGRMTEQPTRKSIIRLARSFMGVPYLWGGKSPHGFDCSGYIQTIYKTFNIELPRDAHQQADHFKESTITMEQAKQADLHFFKTRGKITHVALAEENGYFLHAQGWVKEESFDSRAPNFNSELKNKYACSVSMEPILGI